ncbi:mechanosensitive ion channel family protein [Parvularcula sp. ZS-1/3]|uniref:Small-conductance mechanosensitive channel n=1 Tax=Parvularcula mediterranea TaxID=2732508 RepID=A0A7Y3RP15_9PROT|nr:mechanosensitive ion channel family protein [Parvularcula mediterranea]NNU17623.1 mechanosensitive ion channel family protein [Parvularcula mediterranea]
MTTQAVADTLDAVEETLSPAAERTEALVNQVLDILPLLGVALVAVLLFWMLGRFLSRRSWILGKLSRGSNLIKELLERTIPIVFLLLGIVVGLNIIDAMGVLSAVLGAAGVVGIAVGFAIRDTIENFIASVMLSIRQPFRPKDFVDIDGRQGSVVRLTSRATILMTPDGVSVRIPNAQVFKAIITNYTRNPERRITFQLGIDAEDDPRAAMDRGIAKMKALGFALNDPCPSAWIEEVGDSNILLSFAVWIDQSETDFLKAKSAAIRAVKDTLEAEGFTLPEPIYRLRIDQLPEALKATVFETDQPFEAPPPKKKSPRAPDEEDTSADKTIEEKVEEDRAASGEEDLLDEDKPTEFGDDGKDQPPA